MIEARSISVELRGRCQLHQLSINVKPGEITAVIGANGAGKTTLLRALASEIPVASGTISINREPMVNWSSRQLSRLRAVLPQYSQLDFPFTVNEVVLMGRGPYQRNPSHDQSAVDTVMALTDVSALAQRRYTNLSGGEQQRVQLARVLAQIWDHEGSAQRYLLLDEPVAALDLARQYRFFERLSELARTRQIGILVTLHDLNLTARYADHVILLKQGRQLAAGTANAVLTEANIKAGYDIEVYRSSHPSKPEIAVILPR